MESVHCLECQSKEVLEIWIAEEMHESTDEDLGYWKDPMLLITMLLFIVPFVVAALKASRLPMIHLS